METSLFTPLQVEIICQISQFIGHNPHHLRQDHADWEIGMEGEGEGVIIDFKENEIKFVDCNVDPKTYFAIVGFGQAMGFTIEDYFIEK